MKTHSGDLAWGIKIGLLGVVAFMTWPIWGELVAGFHHFTPAVAAIGAGAVDAHARPSRF